MNNFISIKTLQAKVLLALFILGLSQVSYANDHKTNNGISNSDHSQNSQQQKNVKTFYLNLWAPDQVAPADATPAEYGNNYQYRYTPNSHEVQASNISQTVVFKLHPDLKKRYRFRWISSDQPQLVSFNKVKKHKIKVNVDAQTIKKDENVYFEVWVYDTLTDEVLMCDPKVRIRL